MIWPEAISNPWWLVVASGAGLLLSVMVLARTLLGLIRYGRVAPGRYADGGAPSRGAPGSSSPPAPSGERGASFEATLAVAGSSSGGSGQMPGVSRELTTLKRWVADQARTPLGGPGARETDRG